MAIVFLLLFPPSPAAAYVDPGSGAMLWQAIAATMLGAAFYVRRIGEVGATADPPEILTPPSPPENRND